MAKQYEVTSSVRMVNKLTSFTAGRGWGRQELLVTTGRSSGQPRTVPVSPIEVNGTEYLVAPYGSVAWVKNVRANPSVILRKGKVERSCSLVDVTGNAAEVLHAYYDREPFVRPYMDVPDSPTEEHFAATDDAYPVFEVANA